MAISHLFLNVKLSSVVFNMSYVFIRCMSYVQDLLRVTCGITSVSCKGFSVCYVWAFACVVSGVSLSHVRSFVFVMYCLQSRTSSFRSEHDSLRSVGCERQETAHDKFLSSEEVRRPHGRD